MSARTPHDDPEWAVAPAPPGLPPSGAGRTRQAWFGAVALAAVLATATAAPGATTSVRLGGSYIDGFDDDNNTATGTRAIDSPALRLGVSRRRPGPGNLAVGVGLQVDLPGPETPASPHYRFGIARLVWPATPWLEAGLELALSRYVRAEIAYGWGGAVQLAGEIVPALDGWAVAEVMHSRVDTSWRRPSYNRTRLLVFSLGLEKRF